MSHEIFTHTVALPKSSVPKMKNSHPVWNKAVHFDLDSPRGKSLNIVVNETSDNGQQSNIGNASIEIDLFQGLVGGQEGVCKRPENTIPIPAKPSFLSLPFSEPSFAQVVLIGARNAPSRSATEQR